MSQNHIYSVLVSHICCDFMAGAKMKGRKPVPTGLKLLRGNPGKRAINLDEPKPEPGIPVAPAHLSEDAKIEWDRITAELNILGLVSQIDRAALTVYCTAWGRHVEAENHLRVEGLMLIGKPKDGNAEGSSYQNPWAGVSNRAIELMQSVMGEFGLTPSARTRLSVKQPKAKSKEEALFG